MYLDSHCSYPVPAAAKKEFAKVENDLFSPPAALPKHVNRRQAGGAALQVSFSTTNLSLNQTYHLNYAKMQKYYWKTVPKRIFAHFL